MGNLLCMSNFQELYVSHDQKTRWYIHSYSLQINFAHEKILGNLTNHIENGGFP